MARYSSRSSHWKDRFAIRATKEFADFPEIKEAITELLKQNITVSHPSSSLLKRWIPTRMAKASSSQMNCFSVAKCHAGNICIIQPSTKTMHARAIPINQDSTNPGSKQATVQRCMTSFTPDLTWHPLSTTLSLGIFSEAASSLGIAPCGWCSAMSRNFLFAAVSEVYQALSEVIDWPDLFALNSIGC